MLFEHLSFNKASDAYPLKIAIPSVRLFLVLNDPFSIKIAQLKIIVPAWHHSIRHR